MRNLSVVLTLIFFSSFASAKRKSICQIALGSAIPQFSVDQVIETPKGTKVQVLRVIQDGNKGLVYQVRVLKVRKEKYPVKEGQVVALKAARTRDEYVLNSFRREKIKDEELSHLSDFHYSRILEGKENYYLKEWVEGVRGDEWAKNWIKDGCKKDDQRYKDLVRLYSNLAKHDVYVGNLKDLNVIHDGKDWVVVDAGNTERVGTKAALAMYKEKFTDYWMRGQSDCTIELEK